MFNTIKKFITSAQSEGGKIKENDFINLIFKPTIAFIFLANDYNYIYSSIL